MFESNRRLVLAASVALTFAGAVALATTSGTRDHWCGYAAATSVASPQSGAVTDVKGSFTVPALTGTSDGNALVWVGFDSGMAAPGQGTTVEQIGVRCVRSGGQTSYDAWYEMWPDQFIQSIRNFPVAAGDSITAEARYAGTGKYHGKTADVYQLSITNVTRNRTFSTQQYSTAALRQTAQWIVEPVVRGGTPDPLANFGTVTFSDCSATLNGHTGTISDAAWENLAITMQSNTTGVVKAVPSALSPDGSSFSVAWVHE